MQENANTKKMGRILFVTANEFEKAAFGVHFNQDSNDSVGTIKGKPYYLGSFGGYNVAYIHIDEQGVINPAATP